MKSSYRTLRLILGDQLNSRHSWFSESDDKILYLVAEIREEATYVKHHIQKISAFFAAMQNFAELLQQSGHQVLHLTLDDTSEFGDLQALVASICKRYSVGFFEYQAPDEYRVKQHLAHLDLGADVAVEQVDSEHFLLPFEDIPKFFKSGAHNRMESFYRKMRVRLDLLMDDGQPEGGKWNFDQDNRQRIKTDELEAIPAPLRFSNDVTEILNRIDRHAIPTLGERSEQLLWPTTASQAQEILLFFCRYCLPNFGRFQDAMTEQSPHAWSLYHSRLSFALNTKILHPLEVIQSAIDTYRLSNGAITISQIEGFVRQIIGWREYMRGLYWINMPEYEDQNYLQAETSLPDFFWTANTRMNCVQKAIQQSLDYAYAHHIQRLMVTGNFCLLAGIDPHQVDDWYLGIYIDALQWVELPNTRGMSQFADGGWVATKPYTSSGNYINKMSDYCKTCYYEVKQKTTESACPLNSMYWSFMIEHRDKFEKNPRIGMIYRNWDKQSSEQQEATLVRAKWCLQHLEEL